MAQSDQAREITGPGTATIKRLFAHSGNRCAFPKCPAPIIDGTKVVGKICHIKARSEGGPRYDPNQTSEERHDYDNLILLCGRHHDVIDDDPDAYTVDRLQRMKLGHEGTATVLSSEEAEQGAQLLLDQSVSTTHQSGGITAHSVTINYNKSPVPLMPTIDQAATHEPAGSAIHPTPT